MNRAPQIDVRVDVLDLIAADHALAVVGDHVHLRDAGPGGQSFVSAIAVGVEHRVIDDERLQMRGDAGRRKIEEHLVRG